jgi:uncharacterized OB-fold protein
MSDAKKIENPTIMSRKLLFLHKIPILKTKKFWDGLKEGKIYATRCRKCGQTYYPPQADCSKCLASDMEYFEVANEGEIVTFVASYLVPQGFENYQIPYIIAIVKTSNELKLMGFVEGIDYKNIKVGMKVKITTKIQSDGFPAVIFIPC